MSTHIGFIILSHNHPQQLRRLVLCLQRIYDNPPIAIHHDFSQSSLQQHDFSSDVQFVRPHEKTSWGNFSLVVAVLRALELLYKIATPDWFVLLSGADYPTMPADQVLQDLTSSGVDALLDCREVPNLADGTLTIINGLRISKFSVDIGIPQPTVSYPPPDNPLLKHFVMSTNLGLAWRRYIGFRVWLPIVRRSWRPGRYLFQLPFEDRRSPFTPKFKCYYGDHWFAGNHKVAETLLNPTKNHIKLRDHLRFRYVPDECYYHSVLCNLAGLKISKATKRFTDWSQSAGGPHGGPSPKLLTLQDLPAIVLSKSHFGRKFAPDSPVLDELDKRLR